MNQVESASKLDNCSRFVYRSMSVLLKIFRSINKSSKPGVRNRLRTFRLESLEKREVFSNTDLIGFDSRAQSEAHQPDHFFVGSRDERAANESRNRANEDLRSSRELGMEQTQRIAGRSTISLFSRHPRFEPSELKAEGEFSPIQFDFVLKTIASIVDASLSRSSASVGGAAVPRENKTVRDTSVTSEARRSSEQTVPSAGSASLIRDNGYHLSLQHESNVALASHEDWRDSLRKRSQVNQFANASDYLMNNQLNFPTEHVSAPTESQGIESQEAIDSVFAIDNNFFEPDLFHSSICEREDREGASEFVVQSPLKQAGKSIEREEIGASQEDDWRELPEGMVYFDDGIRGFDPVSYEQTSHTFRATRLAHYPSSSWIGGSGLGLLQWFATYVEEEHVADDWSDVIADQSTGHFLSVDSVLTNSGSESELMLVLLIGGALGGSRGFYVALKDKSVRNLATRRPGKSQAKLWPWQRAR